MDTEPELVNRQPKWFKPVFYGTVTFTTLAVVVGAFIATYLIQKRRAEADASQAYSNARSFGLALFEFETEYGAFPNDSTSALVEANYTTAIDLTGTSSNALFRQLFAANITQSEQMFYAKINGFRKPDGIISPGHILELGECGFSYISGLSYKDDPATPLALTPLIPGTTTFDPKPFKGKAIVLHIDNSVRSYKIGKDGHIYDKGIDILSPKHPVWKGKAPDIRYPE